LLTVRIVVSVPAALIIGTIEAFFRAELPQVGAKIRGLIIQLLLYADDLTQTAESPVELQFLHAIFKFSTAVGLTESIKKYEIAILVLLNCAIYYFALVSVCVGLRCFNLTLSDLVWFGWLLPDLLLSGLGSSVVQYIILLWFDLRWSTLL
jgi:uncharacterized membrane protein YkgB